MKDKDGRRARVVYFVAPGKVETRRVALPAHPAPGHVLLESRLMGISHGTEMLLFRGQMPEGGSSGETLSALAGLLQYPLPYGYINVAQDEQGRRRFAFFPHQDRFYVPEEETILLPQDISDEDAVFTASMETAVCICQDAHPVPGDCVLVVGQGVIGILVAAVLSRFHLGGVVTLEPRAARRAVSESMGCMAVGPSEERAPDQLMEATDGRGFDVAINTSSSPEGMQQAIDSLAFGGTLVEASFYGSKPVTLNLGERFHRARLTIRSTQVSTVSPRLEPRWSKSRRMELALDLLRRIRPGTLITHRFPMEEAQSAYRLIDRGSEETLQVVLEP